MKPEIKMVAVDVDGTFVRSDYTYDVPRFKRILSRMNDVGCHFVVASGNQYYQLRDLFPGYYDELSFVAENGAFVKDRQELVFTANMPKETVNYVIDVCREYPEVLNVLCGVNSAYCERGTVSQDFFDLTSIYYHRLQWVDDFKEVNDQILKFAPTVPEEKTYEYYDMFRERLKGKLVRFCCGWSVVWSFQSALFVKRFFAITKPRLFIEHLLNKLISNACISEKGTPWQALPFPLQL